MNPTVCIAFHLGIIGNIIRRIKVRGDLLRDMTFNRK